MAKTLKMHLNRKQNFEVFPIAQLSMKYSTTALHVIAYTILVNIGYSSSDSLSLEMAGHSFKPPLNIGMIRCPGYI